MHRAYHVKRKRLGNGSALYLSFTRRYFIHTYIHICRYIRFYTRERDRLEKLIRSEVNFKFHEKFNEFPIFEIGLHAAASNDIYIYSSESIERSNSL